MELKVQGVQVLMQVVMEYEIQVVTLLPVLLLMQQVDIMVVEKEMVKSMLQGDRDI